MEFEKFQQIIADVLQLEPEQITMEKSFEDDLGADSLDKIDILMNLEDLLNIEIPDEDVENIVTVGDAVERINRLIG